MVVDQFHKHEVIHTSHMLTSMFDEFIVQAVYVKSDPELKKRAEEISKQLADFYQFVSSKTE